METETIQQSESFEDIAIKYLEKKGVVRFSEFFEWLQTVMKNPPAKSKVSISLDKLANDGKIFSWNKKGARYIAPICDVEKVKNDVYSFMKEIWLEKDKLTFHEIEEHMDYPPQLINDVLLMLVSEGKILNNTINNVTYYRLPPVHSSIKLGIPLIAGFSVLYFFFEKIINKDYLFVAALFFLSLLTVLWYKKR